jgi:hypothetical protein
MKLLYVGDCHATPGELDEMEALLGFIEQVAKENEVGGIVFLGDQFHTHATVNVYVLQFWHRAFKRLAKTANVIAIVGNHDIPGKADAREGNALSVFAGLDNVHIVEAPTAINGVVFAPYFHDKVMFENFAWPEGKTLVCHQTFMGAQYENGFYDKDGAFQEKLPFESILSGHIHKQAVLGKVHYLGSPRWRVVDDANEEKHVWVIDHAQDGSVVSKTPFYTGGVCTTMYHFEWKEGETIPFVNNPKARITVDLIGPEPWIKECEANLASIPNIRTRRFFVTENAPKVRESEGLAQSFKKYVESYPFPNKSDPEAVWNQIAPQVSWLNG